MNIPTTGIIGAVCGDIIGLPYELRADRTKDYNFPLKLTDFSDDTILTVAIAHWLLGKRTEEKLRENLLEYSLRFRHKNVWGRGYQAWFESGGTIDRKGVASNGAAMRVAAIGYASDDLQEVLRLAEMSARITHDSDEAARGAQAVAAAVLLTRTGHSKREVRDYLEQLTGYDLHRQLLDIRPNYQFEILCDRCVPESIICWLESDTYEQAVRNAVSLGGDADTMAAIAGGISAATPGMEVPEAVASDCFNLLPDDFKEIVTNPLFMNPGTQEKEHNEMFALHKRILESYAQHSLYRRSYYLDPETISLEVQLLREQCEGKWMYERKFRQACADINYYHNKASHDLALAITNHYLQTRQYPTARQLADLTGTNITNCSLLLITYKKKAGGRLEKMATKKNVTAQDILYKQETVTQYVSTHEIVGYEQVPYTHCRTLREENEYLDSGGHYEYRDEPIYGTKAVEHEVTTHVLGDYCGAISSNLIDLIADAWLYLTIDDILDFDLVQCYIDVVRSQKS